MPVMPNRVTFRRLPGFPGYRVGSDGTVWSCWKKGRQRKCFMSNSWRELSQTTSRGYRYVRLSCNGRYPRRQVHSLVLEAFVGPKPAGAQCRHFPDPARSNNKLANLSWATAKVNQADRRGHGTDNKGERHGRARLTIRQVRRIKDLAAQNVPRRRIAARYGITPGYVGDLLRGRAWSHVA